MQVVQEVDKVQVVVVQEDDHAQAVVQEEKWNKSNTSSMDSLHLNDPFCQKN